MNKTPYQKNLEAKGTLMGKAAIAGGWTPEMKEEFDYLNACWGELLAPSGTFTGKPNPAREQELGDLMEAGVYRSLYNLETHGTEGDAIFKQMQMQIEAAKTMKDPVLRKSLEQLLRIGQRLGMTVEEQLQGTGFSRPQIYRLAFDSAEHYIANDFHLGDRYLKAALPAGKDSSAA